MRAPDFTRPRIVRQPYGAETLIPGSILTYRRAHEAFMEWLRSLGLDPSQMTLDNVTVSADRMRVEYVRYDIDDEGRRHARLDGEPWKSQAKVDLDEPAPPWPDALLKLFGPVEPPRGD